jgi:hypothetical protein
MSDNRQDNNPRASAEQVWKSLLEDLKQTPLEIPETWPQDTSAQWSSDDLCLVVTVPSITDNEWIERKLFPLASIYFREEHKQKNLLLTKRGDIGKNDLLVQVQKGAYDQVVNPRRMVPVPFYLFQHWLPVLGASLFWVAIAIRQQSFVNTTKKGSVHKLISTRELAHWAPLSYSQIARLLNKAGFSNWFFIKEKEGYQDVPPEFKVWSQIPVAPHHLFWIENYFKERKKEETAISVIESLLGSTGKIRSVKKKAVDVPSRFSNQRLSIIDIVAKYFPGELNQHVHDLVTELEHQITRENMFLSIPHYFFEKYGDELSSNEAALVWYLRSVYKEEGNDSLLFDGYSQIKNALGCSLNTAKNLLSTIGEKESPVSTRSWNSFFQADLSLENWLLIDHHRTPKNGLAGEFTIRVRATEPIHTNDIKNYEYLVNEQVNKLNSKNIINKPAVKNATPENSVVSEAVNNATPEFSPEFGAVKNATRPINNETPSVNNETVPINSDTGNLSNLPHLKSLINNKSLNDSFNNSLIPPLPDGEKISESSLESSPVGVGEINIEKLLGFGSYKHNEKKKLVKLINKNQKLFLAWILRNHITAAKFPVRLAVSNLKEGNITEDHYLELAELGWGITAQLARMNEHDLSMWELGIYDHEEDQEKLVQAYKELSALAKKELTKLRETSYFQLFENVKPE